MEVRPGGLVSGTHTLKKNGSQVILDESGASKQKKLSKKISQEKLIEEKLETNKKLMNIMNKL